MTPAERAAVIHNNTNAEAARILGLTPGSLRVLACKLRKAGHVIRKIHAGRPPGKRQATI